MAKSVCKITDPEKLADEFAKEIDDMNRSGMFIETSWAIGEYLGFQIQIRITREEDDFLDLSDVNNLIEFN